jgi:hypothetical protein
MAQAEFSGAIAAVAVLFVLQPGFETLGWAYSGGQL